MNSLGRLEKVASRAGADLRDAIENLPGLGGIALWVDFADTNDAACVAATDGNTVFVGSRYSSYTEAERRFILLHELLHVALAHPAAPARSPPGEKVSTSVSITSRVMRLSTPRSRVRAARKCRKTPSKWRSCSKPLT